MKKAVLFAMAVLVGLQIPMVAMAHGHHGSGHHGGCRQSYVAPKSSDPMALTGQYSLSVCNVEGCNHTEVHLHDNVFYYGHYDGDGCDYHQLCTVEGCLETTEHEHDGVVCLPCR